MIFKPEHYLFVDGASPDDLNPHGDLNRIIMNGKIMPISEQPFRVRGEDITFLMEAVGEREAAYLHSDTGKHTFTRYRSAGQVVNIVGRIKRAIEYSGSPGNGWIKPGEEWPENMHSSNYREVLPDEALFSKFLHAEDMKSDASIFRPYSTIRTEDVWNIYKDVEALDTVVMSEYVSRCDPDYSYITSDDERDRYYAMSVSEQAASIRYPSGGSTYSRFISGTWHPGEEDPTLSLDYDQVANLKNFELSWSRNSMKYLSGKSGEMDMWALFEMSDFDSSRDSADRIIRCYALVKLMPIPEGALRDGSMHFPTGYLTNLSERLLQMAKSDCGYSGKFPPFDDRTASDYKPEDDSFGRSFSHSMSIVPDFVFLHARIRDRTRWKSQNN